MHNRISNWFALVLLTTGIGLILGYVITPTLGSFVSFDKTTIEFPTIGWKEFGTQHLKIRNVSAVKVQFVASAECHCTNVVPSKGSLEPGETIDLEINYRPKLQSAATISVEKTMVRFELFDGKRGGLKVIPISAEVLKPFEMDPSQLTVTQFGIKPVEFKWRLKLMEDVQSLKVEQTPEFISEFDVSALDAESHEITIRGITKARIEMGQPVGDIELSGVTKNGRKFRTNLSTRVQFQEAFRISPDTIRLQPGQFASLTLNQLDPSIYACKIEKIESELKDVQVTHVLEAKWQLTAESTESNSGYVKLLVRTLDLDSGQSVLSEQFMPVIVAE
jgi:Protein of unknown function (DUF1573)